jgi:7,8-dihydropterin-6-yl-methyl-4-(beta-D-ribofuranosyl)aminobenzene 5'-phosphate synthase
MKKIIKITALILLIVIVAQASTFYIRSRSARQQIQRDVEAAVEVIAPEILGSTASLSILPLYEKGEAAVAGLQTGHGVSYLIRTAESSILLDVGNNPDGANPSPLIHNLQVLGIGLDEIDTLVISHPHPDHIGGTQPWQKAAIAAEGLQVNAVYVPEKMAFSGATPQLAVGPLVIAPGVATLGRQPFNQLFPMSIFNPLAYEQSLVVNVTGQGLVVITGCGHPTIERIVERAEDLFDLPVIGVVGGLHYGPATQAELQPHIDFLAERPLALVALSPHDSGPAAREAFANAFPGAAQAVQVGREIQFP